MATKPTYEGRELDLWALAAQCSQDVHDAV